MATTWLSNLFRNTGGAVGYPGGSAKYTPPAQTNTAPRTINQSSVYAGRMKAMETYYRTRYNALTGIYAQGSPGAWRRPTSEELAGIPPRSGYANTFNRTQQEYLVGQNLRGLNNFMPGTGMSQDEWLRRQRAAPLGYTYTPYAGWVQTPSASGLQNAPSGNGVYAGGGGYGGSGSGGSAGAGIPAWYQNFLNQYNWRI